MIGPLLHIWAVPSGHNVMAPRSPCRNKSYTSSCWRHCPRMVLGYQPSWTYLGRRKLPHPWTHFLPGKPILWNIEAHHWNIEAWFIPLNRATLQGHPSFRASRGADHRWLLPLSTSTITSLPSGADEYSLVSILHATLLGGSLPDHNLCSCLVCMPRLQTRRTAEKEVEDMQLMESC